MLFTVRCNGHVLGTTELDLPPLLDTVHSGWLTPSADAIDVLHAVSIGYPTLRAWLLRLPPTRGQRPTARTDHAYSEEFQAICASVAVRLHLVLSLHRADGTKVNTPEVVIQDRHFWPSLGNDQGVALGYLDDADDEVDEMPLEFDAATQAQIDADVEHDLNLLKQWHPDWFDASAATAAEEDRSERGTPARRSTERSRYQVHLVVDDPSDLSQREVERVGVAS